MSFHAGRKIIYFMIETPAGQYVGNAALFVAGNATVPFSGSKFSPEVDYQERSPEGPSLQPIEGVKGTHKAKIAFQTALYTGGALGIAPSGLGTLFKACFCSEAVVASTSVTYASDPNSQVRLSIGYAILKEDGSAEVQHAISGAAGNFKIKADSVGKLAVIDWEFEGAIAYEAGATLVAVDDATPQTTLAYADEVSNRVKFQALSAGTGLFAAGLNCGGFEFDRGAAHELETDITNLAGFNYSKFSGDKPTVSVAPVLVPVATRNYLSDLVSAGTTSNGFTLGSTAGKKVSFSWPKLQDTALSDDARGVTKTWGVTASAVRTNTTAASDAFSITFA